MIIIIFRVIERIFTIIGYIFMFIERILKWSNMFLLISIGLLIVYLKNPHVLFIGKWFILLLSVLLLILSLIYDYTDKLVIKSERVKDMLLLLTGLIVIYGIVYIPMSCILYKHGYKTFQQQTLYNLVHLYLQKSYIK